MRTPITVLKGYGQLLESDPDIAGNAFHANLVSGIVSGANRLYEIVNTMLLMIKIDSSGLEIKPFPFSLTRLLRKVCASLAEDVRNRQQTLELDASLDKLPTITG